MPRPMIALDGARRGSSTRRWVFALGVLAVLGAGAPVEAHTFAPALLALRERTAGMFNVRFELPGGRERAPALEPRWPAGCRFEAGAARLACDAGALDGARVQFAPEVDAEILVRIEWLDGHVTSGAVERGGRELALPPRTDGARVPWRYARLGVTHILFGFDHLLFILGLTLLVRRARALALALTAFTLGHSATLALATLGVVAIPSPPVEALIAVSLIVLALELTRGDANSLLRRRPGLLAFGFGLVHGLGFAGALHELGLPRDAIPLALVAFNAGVEAGQLAFVAALLGAAALLRRLVAPGGKLALVPVYALGSVGAALLADRVLAFWAVTR